MTEVSEWRGFYYTDDCLSCIDQPLAKVKQKADETRKQAKDKTTLWNKTKSMKIKTRQIKYSDYLRRIRWNRSIPWIKSKCHSETQTTSFICQTHWRVYIPLLLHVMFLIKYYYSSPSVNHERHSPDSSQFGQQL